jgi:hypothetical protein
MSLDRKVSAKIHTKEGQEAIIDAFNIMIKASFSNMYTHGRQSGDISASAIEVINKNADIITKYFRDVIELIEIDNMPNNDKTPSRFDMLDMEE